jgi:hypothetical protein
MVIGMDLIGMDLIGMDLIGIDVTGQLRPFEHAGWRQETSW